MIPRTGYDRFLADAGWCGALVQPLAGDASFRRYFRVHDRGRRAVLMDAPPELEDVRPFVQVADFLVSAGLSAPRLLAGDIDRGFLLIEDFGDRLVGPVLATEPVREEVVYGLAVNLLSALQRLAPHGLQAYDHAALSREVMVFADWYARAAGIDVDAASFLSAWDAVWGGVLEETAQRPVVTLRDYHADNLMLLPDRPGLQALGLLDFQDALAGHPAYDLVSLLQDARRDVSPRLERAMMAQFVDSSDGLDAQGFRAAYEILGAQRNVKILGVFVRLRNRDGRQGYVERLPRVWGYLERNFAHPALAPVKAWFDSHVPAELRSAWCR
ncbi:MAG: phosphotransferase [Sandarakinorhabdus sp.]|nr:phosphotransferase [Sandarakinorhabdus sp.]